MMAAAAVNVRRLLPVMETFLLTLVIVVHVTTDAAGSKLRRRRAGVTQLPAAVYQGLYRSTASACMS